MANMITGIISITIGAVIFATVFMSQVKSANTSYVGFNSTGGHATVSMSAAELAMWGLLGLIGVVGLVYGTLAIFGIA